MATCTCCSIDGSIDVDGVHGGSENRDEKNKQRKTYEKSLS
jgi:hypothetical protein